MSFSIIIPYGNAETTIRRCLDSVLVAVHACQVPCEVICINGGCGDGTPSILDGYVRHNSCIVHIARRPGSDSLNGVEGFSGPGQARNEGLNQATGDYVVFVDADDELHADALVRLLECHYDIVTFLGPPGQYDLTLEADRERLFSPMIGNLLVWNAVYRRSIIADWRFPSLYNHEDIVWTAGMFARAKTLQAGVAVWYDHHEHVAGSLANTNTWRRVRDGWKATGLLWKAGRLSQVGVWTRIILCRKLALHLLLHVLAIVPRAVVRLDRRPGL